MNKFEIGKEYIFQPVCPSCGNFLNHTNYDDIFYCTGEKKGFVLLPFDGQEHPFGILRNIEKLGYNIEETAQKGGEK